MMNASEFADALGRKKLADAVGVGTTAVSNAVVRGWFPASWFLVCDGLAGRAGVPCPPHLFRMRAFNDTPNVDCVQDLQGHHDEAQS